MTRLRYHLLQHRPLAMAIVLVALCMKLLVPVGFMPTVTNGVIAIEICSGHGPQKMAMEMPGAKHGAMSAAMPKMPEHHGEKGQTGAREMPCGFGGLSMPSLETIDPLLLALGIAFIVVMGWRIVAAPSRRIASHLRPPLRGPPVTA